MARCLAVLVTVCLLSVCAGDMWHCPEGASPGDPECRYLESFCPYPELKCEEGVDSLCIAPEKWCDGVQDCVHHSDEKDCGAGYEGCVDCWGGGQCVPSGQWCDGTPDCVDGSDEKLCKRCTDEFECKVSGICVPWSRVCDGVNDCGDNSDEACGVQGESPPWCEAGRFPCASGACVPRSVRCDGVADCTDGTDEMRCECTSAELRCDTSLRCVPPAAICDGFDDCSDGSDELICLSCSARQLWECADGECIDPASVCDGGMDCPYGEDENDCQPPCNRIQFECDGACISSYLLCDETDNCPDGEDERNCTIGGCGVRQAPCDDGTCISQSQSCSRREDCSGGEDEVDCGYPAPPGFPVGMTSRYIPDVFVTASSEFKPKFAPFQARYSGPNTYSCWVPSSTDDQWIQVYFGKTTNVTGVVISGGGFARMMDSWVTSFTLAFSMDGVTWMPYGDSGGDAQVFQGNRDPYNQVSRPLDHPVTSRYIRLYPTGYRGWGALRMEVYVTNDEDTWLQRGEYSSLVVDPDPLHPRMFKRDLDYSASSRVDAFYPHQARLNNGRGQQQGACWSPGNHTDGESWLQITHDVLYRVAGVITQGAYNMDAWVTSYRLEFSLDGQIWTTYKNSDGEAKVFQGNTDNYRYARSMLDNPVFALYTRFIPITFHNQIALRAEILVMQGCAAQEVFCDGRCQAKGRLCLVLGRCVPRQFQYEDKPICEEILQATCGTESTIKFDELGCSECVLQCETESGDPCIPKRWICDNTADCLDGEDEQGCSNEKASIGCFFKCLSGAFIVTQICVPPHQLGDGQEDCGLGEDEDPRQVELALEAWFGTCNFNCPSVYGNASCVPDVFVCDDTPDCLGEEDEQSCGVVEESCFTFSCGFPGDPTPLCVPEHLICDGHPDCLAGEDEQGCGPAAAGMVAKTTGQETEEPTVNVEAEEGPTVGQEATAEPSSGRGPPDGQPGFHAESGGAFNRAPFWMTAAAIGVHIFYR
ncbi:uncharacterized protein LOC144867408 [Branchiostoma floridae x Branchiostoma japonicum]